MGVFPVIVMPEVAWDSLVTQILASVSVGLMLKVIVQIHFWNLHNFLGRRCDKPIKDHYFPTLWQLKYEAESGRQADGKPVRYAIDKNEFPDYSYRGYAVFSPIQDEIYLDIDVKRASVYRLLFHYKNPTDIFVELAATFVPIETNANGKY